MPPLVTLPDEPGDIFRVVEYNTRQAFLVSEIGRVYGWVSRQKCQPVAREIVKRRVKSLRRRLAFYRSER